MNAFALVRTDVFRPLLDEFKASGRRVTRLGLLDGSEIVWVPSRALEDVHPVFAPLRRRRNAGWAAAVLLVTAAAATYGHVFYRYEQAESKLAQVVETKTAEALAVRKLLDQQKAISDYAASVRRAKADAIPVVDVWEELTRRLPDDAWVTDMAVDRDSVALTGFARAAAGLIGEIGASDFLGEVAFTAPVVRMPDPGGERFELRARVRKP
jgi:general secretion pathway protein L